MKADIVAVVTAEGTLCWYNAEYAACAYSSGHCWAALDLWSKWG